MSHLELVKPSPRPWERQTGESVEDHFDFRLWLTDTEGGRPIPPDPMLADRWRWAERARAFDQALDDTAVENRTIDDNLRQLAILEVKKLLTRARQTDMSVIQVRDILLIWDRIQGVPVAQSVADAGIFSSQELETIRELQRKRKAAGL